MGGGGGGSHDIYVANRDPESVVCRRIIKRQKRYVWI